MQTAMQWIRSNVDPLDALLLNAHARLHASALDALSDLAFDLIEAHISEFEDNHGGDADHPGEAPEACTYCRNIETARELLKIAGRDVSALTPEA